MIGATAKAEQFYTRSGSESTKGSRKGFGLLGGGEDPTRFMTEDQRLMSMRASLLARLEQVKAGLTEENAIVRAEAVRKGKPFHQALERRDRLKIEYQRVNSEFQVVKEKLGGMRVALIFEKHFIDVCREEMTASQFKRVLAEAYRRAATAQAEVPA